MTVQSRNKKYTLALKSIAARYHGSGHAPRLSNRLGNGISNADEFGL
jgi:hypothetical protein